MDQNAIVILILSTLLAQKPAPCNTVREWKPWLKDIPLEDPSGLTRDYKKMLVPLAAYMRRNNCSIVIEGYMGRDAKNREDLARANTVKDFLTKELPEAERVRFNQVTVQPKGSKTPKTIARVVP
ncbi:hypothetical protein [Mesorhizobium sp. CN2-181]|uniref:hypothetical protein n=1 Tax=Mesorhizobium yinganensis TaxID=3157707 RepID=UPI0032B7E200